MNTTDDPELKVAKRWTPKIINAKGFTPVANAFLRNYAKELSLTAAEAMLVIHMMMYRWDHKPLEISSATLAEEMGLTPGQARTKLRSLCKKGILSAKYAVGRRKKYDFKPLLVKLEKLLDEQKEESAEDGEDAFFAQISGEAGKLLVSEEDVAF